MAVGTPITTGLDDTEGLEVYTLGSYVYISDQAGGHIGISCDPSGDDLDQDVYPVIHPSLYAGQVYFWGLDNPEDYNANGWTLFQRTVDLALGEGSGIPDDVEGTLTTNHDSYQPGDTIVPIPGQNIIYHRIVYLVTIYDPHDPHTSVLC